MSSDPDVSTFDALPPEAVESLLTACLPVPRWVAQVAGGRPYAAWPALLAAAGEGAAELSDDELAAALAGHPRIGERASAPEHQGELSEREQSGVDAGDAEVARGLAVANAAYERRFDRVFVIRATGRDATEILAELHRRLGNDGTTERTETVDQLREIALIRLRQAVS